MDYPSSVKRRQSYSIRGMSVRLASSSVVPRFSLSRYLAFSLQSMPTKTLLSAWLTSKRKDRLYRRAITLISESRRDPRTNEGKDELSSQILPAAYLCSSVVCRFSLKSDVSILPFTERSFERSLRKLFLFLVSRNCLCWKRKAQHVRKF